MPVKSLEAWLVDLVVQDINDWKKWLLHRSINPKIKNERFDGIDYSTDGTHMRVRHVLPTSDEFKLQLLEVLSSGDYTTAYASDGHARIKVSFSEEALAAFKAEMEVEFDRDTSGDAFLLEHFDVVCTQIGPPDDLIQLDIEKIKYLCHYRKTIGEPSPIENQSKIQQLMADLLQIQQTVVISDDEEDSEPFMGQDTTQLEHFYEDQKPTNLDSGDLSPVVNSEVATQATSSRKKRPFEALDDDILEVRTNDSPLTASGRLPTSRPLKKRATDKEPVKPTELMDLFGNGGIELNARQNQAQHPNRILYESSTTDQVMSHPISQIPANGHLLHGHHSSPIQVDSSGSEISQSPVSQTDGRERDLNSPLRIPSPMATGVAENHDAQDIPTTPQREIVSPSRVSNSASSTHFQQSQGLPTPSFNVERPHIPYGQQNIPSNQFGLLENPSSWFPSLPGRQFPTPNVPVELLKQWTDYIASNQEPITGQSTANPPTPPHQPRLLGEVAELERVSHVHHASSDVSSQSPTTSDAGFDSSQWPPSSPVQTRQELPPDSSFVNDMSGNMDTDDLEVSVPRALPARAPSKPSNAAAEQTPSVLRSADQSPHRQASSWRSSNSLISRTVSQHSNTPQNVSGPTDSSKQSTQSQREPVKVNQRQNSLTPTNFTDRSTAPEMSNIQNSLFRTPPNMYRQRSTQTRISPPPSRRQSQQEPSDSQSLTSSPPQNHGKPLRPLSQPPDPTANNRTRRTNFFRLNRQRREWLKQSFIPDPAAQLHLVTIVEIYRQKFEDDKEVEAEDFRKIVVSEYPNAKDHTHNMKFRELHRMLKQPVHLSFRESPSAQVSRQGASDSRDLSPIHQFDPVIINLPQRKHPSSPHNPRQQAKRPPTQSPARNEQPLSTSPAELDLVDDDAVVNTDQDQIGVRQSRSDGSALKGQSSLDTLQQISHPSPMHTSTPIISLQKPVKVTYHLDDPTPPSGQPVMISSSLSVKNNVKSSGNISGSGRKQNPIKPLPPASSAPPYIPRTAAPQQRKEPVKYDGVKNKVKEENQGNGGGDGAVQTFKKFYEAYKAIRPGGAFAKPDTHRPVQRSRSYDPFTWAV